MPGFLIAAARLWASRAPRRLLAPLLALALGVQPAPGAVTLALLGDVMLGRGMAEAACNGENPLGYLKARLKAADLALANLESPLSDAPLRPGAPYDLRARPGRAAALATAGLDLLSLANNHALDAGEAGLIETRESLRAGGLLPLGPGAQPLFLTRRGLRLALLAFEDVTRPLDLEAATQAVREARQGGAIVIVSLHWGGEYRTAPQARQVALAGALAEAGAALVWGHHPHALQPVAWLKAAGQPNPTLVAYSLGNALFDQPAPPDSRRGALLAVLVDAQGARSAAALPFEIDPRQGCVVAAGPAAAQAIFDRLRLAPRPQDPLPSPELRCPARLCTPGGLDTIRFSQIIVGKIEQLRRRKVSQRKPTGRRRAAIETLARRNLAEVPSRAARVNEDLARPRANRL